MAGSGGASRTERSAIPFAISFRNGGTLALEAFDREPLVLALFAAPAVSRKASKRSSAFAPSCGGSSRSKRTPSHIGEVGAKGIGEIAITGGVAAIANAVYHATGRR